MLTRDAILQADDLKRELVEVPEWGDSVYVRTMTGAERDAFEAEMAAGGQVDIQNIRARLAVLCVVDEDGDRLFTDGDAAALGGKSGLALGRIFDVAQRLNGLMAEDIEELAKNSAGVRSGDSTSA